ncbi:MAG: 3-oxoacyl-[acyl-carrier-protein] synthase III C-terminal domain-containing protein [Acidobacteriota bacterium]
MPRLVDVVCAPPEHVVPQTFAAEFARATFGPMMPNLERLMPIFENAGIATRHLCRPPEWYRDDHSLGEISRVYIEAATTLCAQAGRTLLERHGLGPEAIDRVLYVNTTGLATPSIDARLINLLGLRRNVRRTPIWGLGCAGGVAGLGVAFDHLAGHPRERVLLFCAEMCSLTLLRDDASTGNVVATALFADGAAAALLSGDETGDPGYPLLDGRSVLYPDSLDIMGWNVVSKGLQVIFDRRIPQLVDRHAREELDTFLAASELTIDDITEFLFHPGGPKVLSAYASAFGLELDRFCYSRGVLRDFGNMSSVTVLYVLERYLKAHPPGRGGHAVISALGPGFSSESLLMEL